MSGLIWALKTANVYALLCTIALSSLMGIALFNADYLILLFLKLVNHIVYGDNSFIPGKQGSCLPAMLIIPSLLRDADDLREIKATVESVGNNGYPNDLFVIVAVDGLESPKHYQEIGNWLGQQNYPSNVKLHLTHRKERGGKIMGIDAGVKYMQTLVASGKYPKFPDLYFSVDADSTMGDHALEKVVQKLLTKHPITGNYQRVVAGLMVISPDWFWKGWKNYFTISGQNYLNVAREFLVQGFHRANKNLTVSIALPGPLYVVWSDVLVQAPRYMAFVRTITWRSVFMWWFGASPMKFSEYTGPGRPESLSGGLTDDTTMAILAGIAQWRDGKLCFDAPRTPLHAFGRMIWNTFVERAHKCAIDAKVFTFSPPTLKSLFNQRVRWCSCRPEAGERMGLSFFYHWDISFGYWLMFIERMYPVCQFIFYYAVMPFIFFKSHIMFGFFIGYCTSFGINLFYTIVALILEPQRKKFWRIILSLPTRDLYGFIFGYCATIWGTFKDIFGYGLDCKFIPESTLLKCGGQRVALMYRFTRFFSMLVRSIRYGSVPWGTWWFGFKAYAPYAESGFKGWGGGKKGYSLRK